MVFPTNLTANYVDSNTASVGIYTLLGGISIANADTAYWKMFSDAESYWQADTCDSCQVSLSMPQDVIFDDVQVVSTIPVNTISVYVQEMGSSYPFPLGLGLPVIGRSIYFTFEPAQALLQITSITATYNSNPVVSGNVVPLVGAGAPSSAPSRPTSGLVYPRSR
jgi:hypothetical protein